MNLDALYHELMLDLEALRLLDGPLALRAEESITAAYANESERRLREYRDRLQQRITERVLGEPEPA